MHAGAYRNGISRTILPPIVHPGLVQVFGVDPGVFDFLDGHVQGIAHIDSAGRGDCGAWLWISFCALMLSACSPATSAWCLAVSFCVDKYMYSLYFILVLALIERAWAVSTLYCPVPAA